MGKHYSSLSLGDSYLASLLLIGICASLFGDIIVDSRSDLGVYLSHALVGRLLLHRLPSRNADLMHGVHVIFVMSDNSNKFI